MNNELKKKICILLSIYTLFLGSIVCNKNSKNNVRVTYYNEMYSNDECNFFACCDGHKIFIGSEKEMEELINNNGEDIYVIDERDIIDPNMSIIDSYKITDLKLMRDIILVLQEYERLYPSRWNRTTEAMMVEWIAHNIGYDFHISRDRTGSVDLNNDDERIYLSLIRHI